MNQDMIRAVFHELGLDIHVEESGEKGIEKAKELKPDLILMDMHMPEMDGMEATKQIRGLPEGGDIPIIALSADAFTEQQKAAFEAGVTDYLTKPLDIKKLLPILAKHLRPEKHTGEERSASSTRPPLPEEERNELFLEFQRLAKIPFFLTGEISGQVIKMQKLCEGYESPYPDILQQIEDAAFNRDQEKIISLIGGIIGGEPL